MSVFPIINLRPAVTEFLQSVFLNTEVRIHMDVLKVIHTSVCHYHSAVSGESVNFKRLIFLFKWKFLKGFLICLIWLFLCPSLSCFVLRSGARRGWPSGGRVSLPEAALMPVSPAVVHLCSGQHPSRSPGRNQAQVGRRAEEGESKYLLRCCHFCGQWSPNQSVCCCCCCCCRSSRCAARQQMRRSPFRFLLTREFQMCCSFPWTVRGMWGMLESQSALWKYALRT